MNNYLRQSPILKADDERRLVYGIVLEPGVEDGQGDILDEDTIEKASHGFMVESQTMGLNHKFVAPQVSVVESYIAPQDFEVGDQLVRKGSWVMTVKVFDDELWSALKNDEYTGFSIGGYGTREPA